jgi:hypothetical protein
VPLVTVSPSQWWGGTLLGSQTEPQVAPGTHCSRLPTSAPGRSWSPSHLSFLSPRTSNWLIPRADGAFGDFQMMPGTWQSGRGNPVTCIFHPHRVGSSLHRLLDGESGGVPLTKAAWPYTSRTLPMCIPFNQQSHFKFSPKK